MPATSVTARARSVRAVLGLEGGVDGSGVVGKVGSKHGFRVIDVRHTVECKVGLRATRDADPERGIRYIIKVRIDGRAAIVVLQPIPNDVDVYRLVTVHEP